VSTEAQKREAYRLFKDGDPDKALTIVSKLLNENPNDKTCLFIAGEIFIKASRHGMANPYYRRVVEIDPTMPEAWNNLGHCHHTAGEIQEAIGCFIKALQLGGDESDAYSNLLLMNTVMGDHENALRLLDRAVFHASTKDQKRGALSNSALAFLALRKWKPGWQAFDLMLGQLKQRRKRDFPVPDWDGKTPGLIAVYGEQGLGDEIMFASMMPDLLGSHKAVLECDPRLTGLFARSFACPVFGSRREAEPQWVKTLPITAKAASGSLGLFYRNAEPFPRGPYLKACPQRRKHMRAGLDQLPGRKIGLAWTGGTHSTRQKDRSLALDDLKPLLGIPGITWVSLEYKGDDPGQGIVHWPEITQSNDYDDTAALVSELDGVVSVTTTVALLCGALGVACDVLVPQFPTWHWAAHGDMPWYDSLRLHRRDGVEWESTAARVAAGLRDPQRMAAQ
jgi:tetratricopeptide (TPR) repeat protein